MLSAESVDGLVARSGAEAPPPVAKVEGPPPRKEKWSTVFERGLYAAEPRFSYKDARFAVLVAALVIAAGLAVRGEAIKLLFLRAGECAIELYVIAVFEPAARHALLGLAAGAAWVRVGAPWVPFVFVPVFYASLLPIWLYLGAWLVACCVLPTWAIAMVVKGVAALGADVRARRAGLPSARWRAVWEDARAESFEVARACGAAAALLAFAAVGAPIVAAATLGYLAALHACLDALDGAICVACRYPAVARAVCGHACDAVFVARLLGPARDPNRRLAARIQISAAISPLARVLGSLRHKLFRRVVPKLEPAAGDLCPVCHEDLGEADGGPLAFCRWGCGRAVHEDCIALWTKRSDSCVLCGSAWS